MIPGKKLQGGFSFREDVLAEARKQFGIDRGAAIALYVYTLRQMQAGLISPDASPARVSGGLQGILIAVNRKMAKKDDGATAIGDAEITTGFGCCVCGKFAMRLGEPVPQGEFVLAYHANPQMRPRRIRHLRICFLRCLKCHSEVEELSIIASGKPVPLTLACPKCRKPHIDPNDSPLHDLHHCSDDSSGSGCGHQWAPRRWATHGVPWREERAEPAPATDKENGGMPT